jgi:phage baseplate assembly protein W
MAITYRGFSTVDRYKKFRVTNFELAKRDLLNHFSIRKGEKLMQPNFGTIIWDMIFEPLTETTKSAIIDDVTTIVSYDPRVKVTQVIVDQLDLGIQLQINLTYVPRDQSQSMILTFNKSNNTLTAS